MVQQFYAYLGRVLDFLLLHMLNRDDVWEEFICSTKTVLPGT